MLMVGLMFEWVGVQSGMERLRHSGWRVGTEGDWMGLLMLACVSLETFAITDRL